MKDALAQANKAGRILLVDFYGGWCPWCVKMDQTLADSEVKAILEKQFFYCKLDVGRFDKHADCLKQYKVEGIPYLIAFDSTGAILAQQDGYMKAADFKAFLKKAAEARPGKMTSLDFQQFKDKDDAIEAAVAHCARLNRRLIVYFYADETPAHRSMESLLTAVGEDSRAAGFAVMRVLQSENAGLARRYGCSAAPFLIIFRPNGNVSTFYQEAPERDEFLQALKKAAEQK